MESVANASHREPWNKGKIVGQKVPFKPKDIWALRVRLPDVNLTSQHAYARTATARLEVALEVATDARAANERGADVHRTRRTLSRGFARPPAGPGLRLLSWTGLAGNSHRPWSALRYLRRRTAVSEYRSRNRGWLTTTP